MRFQAYSTTLFSPSTLTLDRDQLTHEELTALNKSISGFLRLLSPYFLSPGALKTVEYLLRKYR